MTIKNYVACQDQTPHLLGAELKGVFARGRQGISTFIPSPGETLPGASMDHKIMYCTFAYKFIDKIPSKPLC